jgi:peptidoglycan/LPS O-acetylase OafA/YrhL
LECLDGLRGVLAAYVLLSHMAPFAAVPAWVVQPYCHGEAAVDVFFIVSGMVIVRSLEGFSYTALPFLVARLGRTFPVFLVVFPVAAAIQVLPAGFAHMPWITADSPAHSIWSEGWRPNWVPEIAAHLTMTHGLFPDGVLPDVWVSFLGPAWSLSTEWQFYLVIAALAGPLGRGRIGSPHLVAFFVGLAAAALFWRIAGPPAAQFSRAFLPNKAAYFALGIASAALQRDPGRAACRFYATVLAVTLALCCTGGGTKLLAPLAWTVCLAAQIGFELTGLRIVAGVLRARLLVWLGAISYSVYLVHAPVQKLLGISLAVLFGGNAAWFTAVWLPGAILLPLGLAWLLHIAIELPGQRWGKSAGLRLRMVPG